MTAEVRIIDLRADPDADLSEVVAHLKAGGVIAYPTETVYGLGSACSEEGVRALRTLKAREADKPFLALVGAISDVDDLSWTPAARELAEIFWPGSLTLVLPDPRGIFPPGVRDPRTASVGVRVSPHPVAARLVTELGAPLTSTSLNRSGEAPATSGDEALAVLARLGPGAVWLLDAGRLPSSLPSTVVDCSGPEPILTREGAVPVGRLRCVIPEIGADVVD